METLINTVLPILSFLVLLFSVIVSPLIIALWRQRGETITKLQSKVENLEQKDAAQDLVMTEYVKQDRFDKEITTLHKINASMNRNTRADFKEVRAEMGQLRDHLHRQ